MNSKGIFLPRNCNSQKKSFCEDLNSQTKGKLQAKMNNHPN